MHAAFRGKVAFGLAILENPDEESYKVAAVPADNLEEAEAQLLEEVEKDGRMCVVEGPRPLEFDDEAIL